MIEIIIIYSPISFISVLLLPVFLTPSVAVHVCTPASLDVRMFFVTF